MSDQYTMMTCRVHKDLKVAYKALCRAQDITLAQGLRHHMRQVVLQHQSEVNARHSDTHDPRLDEHGWPEPYRDGYDA